MTLAADTFADTTAPGERMQFSSCAPSSTLDPFIKTQFTKTEFGPTNAFWAITDSLTSEASETSAVGWKNDPCSIRLPSGSGNGSSSLC